MGSKVKPIIWVEGVNEQWDLPKVVLAMIAADRKYRRTACDELRCSVQRVKFSPLDVHFYIRGLQIAEGFVQSNTLHSDVT